MTRAVNHNNTPINDKPHKSDNNNDYEVAVSPGVEMVLV